MGGRLSGSVEVCVCMHVRRVHVFANMPISVTLKKICLLRLGTERGFHYQTILSPNSFLFKKCDLGGSDPFQIHLIRGVCVCVLSVCCVLGVGCNQRCLLPCNLSDSISATTKMNLVNYLRNYTVIEKLHILINYTLLPVISSLCLHLHLYVIFSLWSTWYC